MKTLSQRLILCFCLRYFLYIPLLAEVKESPPIEWPRTYEKGGHELIVYQPQVEAWENHKILKFKAAISLTPKNEKAPMFGALYFQTRTLTHKTKRLILLKDLQILETHFPQVDEKLAPKLTSLINAILPKGKKMIMSLDRVNAMVDEEQKIEKEIKVNLEPPPIYYSNGDATLVIFLGEEKFEEIKGTNLLFAVNTNWDIFLDKTSSEYFMLHGDSWLKTKDLKKGPWSVASQLPADLNKLPDDANWSEVKKRLQPKPLNKVPTIFVSNKPSELLVTDGEASFTPIAGTRLLYVNNSDADLFLHSAENLYYYLVAGRWFKAQSLKGPWQVASGKLPVDFAKIPEDHEKSFVLASVPGTEDAKAAVLLANVPQKATVKKSDVNFEAIYDGEPIFEEIKGTDSPLYYAVNTEKAVLRVENTYYACDRAIWFVAPSPKGDWAVATQIPDVIYSIPYDHPLHYVTYVEIYEDNDKEVVVGYTSGYNGNYVYNDVVYFGVGYWWGHCHHHHHCHCYRHVHHYSYGCGARYDYYKGVYYRGAKYYGPYGGAGRLAVYNPSTGTYARGAYRYGPYGSSYAMAAYNPYTDRYVARAGGNTPYGSWGKGVAVDGNDWVKGGYKSNYQKSTIGLKNSEGAGIIAGKNKITGEKGFLGKDKNGDIYVGKDGNIYKREDGVWKKRENGSWQNFKKPTTRPSNAVQRPVTRPSTPVQRPTTRPTTPTQRPSTSPGLTPVEQDRQSRIRQYQSSQRSQIYNSLQNSSRSRSIGNSRARTYQRSSRSSRSVRRR
ncbi:carbohydrate-binding family V/XII [Lentisphaera araneosa HTCC2155]|jgi:hypothetical protein|uniref:Carbohydrate-binding family V/XII n=1 Tax=Lentisphaera araneosa HTCC2155 TaxID=313628 RepID=A6DPX0_9BACT|nr:hypothetical protein [Lentisphaera araneosa]EDM26211.1 carbohydrate-binding family V/XII [Lentisphaera araneosa HTCC2155]